MNRWFRYSAVVYIGLIYAGFLHQPGSHAPFDQADPTADAGMVFPHELHPQTWARPTTAEEEAVETHTLKKAKVAVNAMPPKRNPFR